MERKRILSFIALVFITAAIMLSLVSCGGERLEGVEIYAGLERNDYNTETGVTSVSVVIDATNSNSSHIVRGYKYKLIFKDVMGSTIYTRVFTADTDGIMPGNYDRLFHNFDESAGNGINGEVYAVEAVPVEMVLDNEEVKESGSTAWDFWTWLWVIISGILVYLFFTVCSQEDWDSGTVIGSVVLFLLPAAIILLVYFGFFFGR